jgi:hypothetical protein
MLVLRIELDVRDVDNGTLQDRPGRSVGAARPRRVQTTHLLEAFGREVVLSDLMDQLAVEPEERAEEPVTQSHDALDDRVEDGLDVGRGARDHAQDLARRRLLLERLGQALLELAVLGGPRFADLRATGRLLLPFAFTGVVTRRIGLSLALTGVPSAVVARRLASGKKSSPALARRG